MNTDTILHAMRRSSTTASAAVIFVLVYGSLLIISPQEQTSYAFGNFVALLSPLALAAAGTTLVLLTGGFDLSVAGMISLANVLCATYMADAGSPWAVVIIVVGIGLVSGAVNGVLVVFFGLQSLAVSLAVHIVLTGLALVVLPAPGGQIPVDFTTFVQGDVVGLPFGLVLLVGVALAWLLLRRTRTGTAILALGQDREATRLSGVNVRIAEFSAWMVAGGMYALAGVFLSGTTATGSPSAGTAFQLTAFAAMALGLVGFRGGHGSVIAAMLGAATLMAIPKVLFGIGVADFWVGACQGAVILLALALPVAARRIGSARGPKTIEDPFMQHLSDGPTKVVPAPTSERVL